MRDPVFAALLSLALGAGLLVMLVFSAAPGLDLAISSLALSDSGHFAPADGRVALVNKTVKASMELLTGMIVLMAMAMILVLRRPESGARNWVYLAGNLILGPGLLVNGVLKAHFGRARPAQTVDFGGSAQFTPVAEISDQCLQNCSFTSGEAALAASLVFAILPLFWLHLSPRGRWIAVLGSVVFVIIASGLRVYLGRHFMSDVTMSIVFSALIALALYAALGIRLARRSFEIPFLRADMRRFGTLLQKIPGPWRP